MMIQSRKVTLNFVKMAVALILLVLCFQQPVFSQIYKWTDENGKVHYTNKAPRTEKNLQHISIDDQFVINDVADVKPIQYEGSKPAHPIVIEDIDLDLLDEGEDRVTFGQVSVGPGCGRSAPMYWDEGHINFGDPYLRASIAKEFNTAGYKAETIDSSVAGIGGSYKLTAIITKMKANVCFPKRHNRKAKSAIYLKVNWKLTDTINDQVLFTGSSEGSHNAHPEKAGKLEDNIEIAVANALVIASHHLMNDPAFVLHLDHKDLSQFAIEKNTDLQVEIFYGSGSGDFKENADSIKKTSVTIKTEKGHGSGVLVSQQGYVLTNAHVVGNELKVKVKIKGRYYFADVVHKHPVRDVALVKLEEGKINHNIAYVSKDTPSIGSELYVVGTPLDTSLSHTITKGVYSARRHVNGLNYYQTDASINPGNSGGPVFNENGELVALAVSGIFSQGGAGLNVNYLIPIEDVLDKLDIQASDSGVMGRLSSSDSVSELIRIWQPIREWLHVPVFKL